MEKNDGQPQENGAGKSSTGDDKAQSPIGELETLIPVDEHVEEVSENGEKVRRRGIYLLPNLFTTGALFSGFYAVVAAMNGHFENSAVAIFVAMIFDTFDGRVARMTNTQSAFGAEYDSLSDMVSFGVAPALVAFSWALSDLGKLGWAAAFIYVAGAALRLARFNTQVETADKRYFTGLASPSAAAVIAGMVWVWGETDVAREAAFMAAIVVATVGLLMVTNIRYHSFKGIDLHGRVPFVVMLVVVLIVGVITVDPPRVLLMTFALYSLSGPVMSLWSKLKSA